MMWRGILRTWDDQAFIRLVIRLAHTIVVTFRGKNQPTHNNRQQPQPHRPNSLSAGIEVVRYHREGISDSKEISDDHPNNRRCG